MTPPRYDELPRPSDDPTGLPLSWGVWGPEDQVGTEGAQETARRTIRDGKRAADVIARLRALFTKRIYGAGWADEKNFDLVVDTGELSDEEAIAQIVAAYRERQATPGEGRRVADLTTDPVLRESIASVLQ